MSPSKQLEAFAQSIYLTIKNRYFDEIEGSDGQEYISQVVDWCNMYLDELEDSVDANGDPVDWWFARQNGFTLGTAAIGKYSVTLPTTVSRLITNNQRYVQILQDGTPVSNWAVVHPSDITNRSDRITEDMCALVGTSIVFSRPFKDSESNGTIVGDVITSLPRLSKSSVTVLSQVKPKQLLILGVAKNSTLPDIVQGGLSPSYAQKYDALLAGAVARSKATSISHIVSRQQYGGVTGVY